MNVDVLVNLGKVLEKRDALPAALKFYERAYAVSPSFPKLAVTLARLYRYVGAAERARSFWKPLRVEDEDFVMARAECDFELDGEAAAGAAARGGERASRLAACARRARPPPARDCALARRLAVLSRTPRRFIAGKARAAARRAGHR